MSETKAVTQKEGVPGETGVSRRELLNYAWLASIGIILAQMGGVTVLFAMPRFKAGQFGGTFNLGKATSLPAVGADPVAFREGKFWLVRSEKGLLALYKVCTHLGCLYDWVPISSRFECPCHGSKFHRDGTYIEGPAPRSLDRFVVRLVDDQGKEIAATDSQGNPLHIPGENVIVVVDTGKRVFGKANT